MLRARFGRIVNVTSRASLGRVGASFYSGGKKGLVAIAARPATC
jgi:NAD(P)-dependent dehydrogenase (short-subunit alcohol dehydrogenase family)